MGSVELAVHGLEGHLLQEHLGFPPWDGKLSKLSSLSLLFLINSSLNDLIIKYECLSYWYHNGLSSPGAKHMPGLKVGEIY